MRRYLFACVATALLTFLFSTASSAATPTVASESRTTIVAIAKGMIYGKWVSPVTVYASSTAYPRRWGTFYAGQTYTGEAYTQSNPVENWSSFSANMRNRVGKPGVDQGNDCSGFVSIAWQIPRQTTSTFLPNGYAYRLSSLASLRQGDALLKPSAHVALYYGRTSTGSFQMLEQTTPKARLSTWSLAYAQTYYPVRRLQVTP